MGNLDTLKVAAFVIKDLKNNERVYKTALVKVASKELYEVKTGRPYIEKDAGILRDNWFFGYDSTNPKVKGEYDTYGAFGRIGNYLGRAAGIESSQIAYANSSNFKDDASREQYLRDRAQKGWTKDWKGDFERKLTGANAAQNQWSDRLGGASAKAQENSRAYDNGSRTMHINEMNRHGDALHKSDEIMLNNPGPYGGPGGISPRTGGPYTGPYGRPYGSPYTGAPYGRPYGAYPGGVYGRPYGSVYSRGGYGGRGYGGYGGYYGRGYGGYGGYYGPGGYI